MPMTLHKLLTAQKAPKEASLDVTEKLFEVSKACRMLRVNLSLKLS